jgi:hypothetical protein
MGVQPINLVDYGLTNALQTVFPAPIVSLRAPTTADKAQIGSLWVFKTNNAVYVITSVVNNLANWVLLEVGGGAGVFASLTVTPGPISLTGTTTINTAGAAATTIGTGGTGVVLIGNATGGTAVTGTLTVSGQINTIDGNVFVANDAAAATPPLIETLKSRAGGVITTGDGLGQFAFGGYDGTQYTEGALISSTSSGTIGNTRVAGNLQFFTHPDAPAANPTLRMTISSVGNIVVAAPDAGVGLTVVAGGITATAGDVTISDGDLVLSAATTRIQLPGPTTIQTGAGVPAGGLAVNTGDLYINTTATTTTTRLYIATGAGVWATFTASA